MIILLILTDVYLKKYNGLSGYLYKHYPRMFPLSLREKRALGLLSLTNEEQIIKSTYLIKRTKYWMYSGSILMSSIFFLNEKNGLLVLSICLYSLLKPILDIQNMSKKIRSEINMTLPNILLQIILLKGAGISMLNAIMKATERQTSEIEIALYQASFSSQSGQLFEREFMTLSKKCDHVYITRFIRIVISDVQKGTGQTNQLLEILNADLWKYKKAQALKKGEEASTKLLLPMSLTLVSVVIAVTIPAIFELLSF